MNRFISDTLMSESSVALEAIDRQKDDQIVKKLESFVAEMRVHAGRGRLKDPNKSMKDKRVLKTINLMEKELEKRFGLKYKILDHYNSAAIYPIPVIDTSPAAIVMQGYYDELKEYFEKFNLSDVTMDNVKNISEYTIAAIYKSAKYVREEIDKGNNVRIDEKNAKILGIKDAHGGVITFDMLRLINVGLTDREIVAILMHEIGHGFTMYSTMHLTANSVLNTMNSLMDMKGDEKATISLIKDNFNLKSDSGEGVLVELTKKLFIGDPSGYVITDNEFLADQFSTRFGLGLELSTALSKIYNVSVEDNSNVVKHNSDSMIDTILKKMQQIARVLVIAFALIILIAALNINVVGLLVFLGLIEIFFMLIFIYSIIEFIIAVKTAVVGNMNNFTIMDALEFTYDRIYERIERIKRDTINHLRTGNISSKDKKDLITKIQKLEKIAANLKEKYSSSAFNKIITYVITSKDGMQHREFFIMLEKMMENDFHYTKELFKTIKV